MSAIGKALRRAARPTYLYRQTRRRHEPPPRFLCYLFRVGEIGRFLPPAALVITALTMPAMIIARLAFTAIEAFHAALVITTLAMPAMIITWFAFAATKALHATLVITTLTMPAVIITTFALAPGHAPVVTDAVIATVTPLAMATSVIAHVATHAVPARVVVHLVTTTHARSSARGHDCAAASAVNSPSRNAPMRRPHAQATGTPAPGIALTAGE